MSIFTRLLPATMRTSVPARFMSQIPSNSSSASIQKVVEQNIQASNALVKVDPFNPPKPKLIRPILMNALNNPDSEKTEEDYDVLAKAERYMDTVFPGSRLSQKMEKAVDEVRKKRNNINIEKKEDL